MGSAIELSNVEDITLVLEDGRLVVVTIEVVGAREEGHDGRETCRPRLSVHPIAKIMMRVNIHDMIVNYGYTIPCVLSFVCSDDRQQLVPLQELRDCLITDRKR